MTRPQIPQPRSFPIRIPRREPPMIEVSGNKTRPKALAGAAPPPPRRTALPARALQPGARRVCWLDRRKSPNTPAGSSAPHHEINRAFQDAVPQVPEPRCIHDPRGTTSGPGNRPGTHGSLPGNAASPPPASPHQREHIFHRRPPGRRAPPQPAQQERFPFEFEHRPIILGRE